MNKVQDFSDNPLVETGWLAEHLGEAGLRVVDARWRGDDSSRELYRAGHIPGAVPLDWHLDLNYTRDGLRDLLLPPARFAEVMGGAGIGDDTLVIAYADEDYSGAARLWWALRYYGHDRVVVLNGGLDKWLAEGRPVTQEIPAPPPARFTPRPRPAWLATAAEIEAALQDQASPLRLVDSRPPEQYAGLAVWTPNGSFYLPVGHSTAEIGARGPMRAGHIPGAINITSSTNLNPADWTYLPPEALQEKFAAAGLNPKQRIITYCGVGISASLGLLALHLAGFRNLALYDASWEEWGTDPAKPIND
jgi:thiosulfate/3-mercaptopyruvate sulfurtransferase